MTVVRILFLFALVQTVTAAVLNGEVVVLIPREKGRKGTLAPIHGGGTARENPLGTGR